MKGMNFGEGTGYVSPQKKAADASAMKKGPKEGDHTYSSEFRDKFGETMGLDTKKAEELLNTKYKEGRRTDKGEVAKGGTKTWEQGSKSSGGNLNKWVAERRKHKKGSAEYNALQNKINKALGSEKRHGEKQMATRAETGTGRTTKSTTTIPGVGTEEKKVVKGTKGNVRKIKVTSKNEEGKVTNKTKVKKNNKGEIVKTKKTDKSQPDTVTKTITKGNKKKVKERKKGNPFWKRKKDESPNKMTVKSKTKIGKRRKVHKDTVDGIKTKTVNVYDRHGDIKKSKVVVKGGGSRSVKKGKDQSAHITKTNPNI